jgi:hypothetical protein
MGRKGMIRFRCWYCNRKHSAGWDRVGERRVCNCGERYRIPRYRGGPSRDKSLLDWAFEFVIYGSGGGLLGCCFGLLTGIPLILTAVSTIGGILVGGLFGERGINWIGSLVRHAEDD